MAVVLLGLNTVQVWLFEIVGERMTRRLRSQYFRALLRQQISFFDDPSNSVGALAAQLGTDTKLVRRVSGQALAAQVQMVVCLSTGVVIAMVASWQLTLSIVVVVPVMAVGQMVQFWLIQGSDGYIRKQLSKLSGTVAEAVSGIREVQTFGLETKVTENMAARLDEHVGGPSRKVVYGGAFSQGFSHALQISIYAVIFKVGEAFISNGTIASSEDMFLVIWPLMFGAGGLGQAAGFLGDASKAKGAAARLFEIIDKVPDIDSKPWLDGEGIEGTAPRPIPTSGPGVIAPQQLRGEITLKGVHFHYPSRPSARIFSGLDITIKPGTTAALVGTSGSGKSTVIQLLERFYDPVAPPPPPPPLAAPLAEVGATPSVQVVVEKGDGTEAELAEVVVAEADGEAALGAGSVCLDGVDVRTLDVKWLRAHLGLVGQEPVLFDATVAENIAAGKPGATRAEVERAAKLANAHEFIVKLANGYGTSVGLRGGKLSGGQKQRVAIARALIKNPKVLLLDEATSALDNESEKMVQASLDALLAQKDAARTTIVIAHRLSTIRHADCIYVLENRGDGAAVVESGTHEELMAKDGKYSALRRAYDGDR